MDFWACWLLSIILCKSNALLIFTEHHLIPAIHVLRGSLYFGFGCRTCELSISIICMQFSTFLLISVFLRIPSFYLFRQGPSAKHVSRRLKHLRWSRYLLMISILLESYFFQAAWPLIFFASVRSHSHACSTSDIAVISTVGTAKCRLRTRATCRCRMRRIPASFL
jgi:hypothetical protein